MGDEVPDRADDLPQAVAPSVIGPGDRIALPRAVRAGRARGRARRRHRPAVPATCPSERVPEVDPRLHLRQRRHRARPAEHRRAVGPGQGLRHVLPARPVDRDRRRPRRPRDLAAGSTARCARTARTVDCWSAASASSSRGSATVMTLLPGDVILTGTPAGVGPIVDGDTVSRLHRRHRHADEPGDPACLTSDLTLPPTGSDGPRPVLPVARPATRTSAWSAPRCSTGRTPGTPAARSSSASRTPTPRATARSPTTQLLDALRWLGLDWDEGPEVGGPHAPYRQSAAPATSTPTSRAELLAAGLRLRVVLHARGGRGAAPGGRARPASSATTTSTATSPTSRRPRSAPRAASPCCACGCPTRTSTWDDLVRGEITFPARAVPDFVIVRGNGEPLYTLVNPVDDALMGITHVLRGEDLLSSHPAPDRAVRRARADRRRRRHDAALRAPAAT